MRTLVPTLLAGAVSGACLLATAGTALAADPPATASPSAMTGHRAEARQHFFDTLDANHDGVVSRAEYQAWVDSRFAGLDSNGDGSVDATEIESSPKTAERVQKRAEAFVKRYDQSGTGKVSRRDFEAREMARFDRIGGGADSVTEEQLAAHRHGMKHGHAPRQDGDAGTDGG